MLNEKSKTDDNDINLNSLIKMFFITFSVILFSAITYFIFHVAPSPLKPSEIGQIGDFYGGLLNPFLTFFTIIFLIWSIRLQSRELAATREELTFTREEIKQTAKSHKELVAQGNASFFIEQAIKSLELTQSEIEPVFIMGIKPECITEAGGAPLIVFKLRKEANPIGGFPSCIGYLKNHSSKIRWQANMERKLFPDDESKPVIKSLIENVKHQLINFNIVVEHHGWSYALSYLPVLKRNIEFVKHFKMNIQDENLIIDLVNNALRAIKVDVSEIKSVKKQFATIYLLNDLQKLMDEIFKVANNNPFEE